MNSARDKLYSGCFVIAPPLASEIRHREGLYGMTTLSQLTIDGETIEILVAIKLLAVSLALNGSRLYSWFIVS